MKEGTRLGIGLANQKEEKLPVDEADENKFWTLGLLGKNSAKSLLNVVYFYNRKLFGLCASEHRNLSLENLKLVITIFVLRRTCLRHFTGFCWI